MGASNSEELISLVAVHSWFSHFNLSYEQGYELPLI